MVICEYCNVVQNSISQLRKHITEKHPHRKPYTCAHCSLTFKLYGSKKRHEELNCKHLKRNIKQVVIHTIKPSVSSCMNKKTKLNTNSKNLEKEEYKLYLCNSKSFMDWYKMYVTYRKVEDRPLSEDTANNVNGLISVISNNYSIDNILLDTVLFEDFIDNYIDDKQTKMNPSSISNHLRYIRWMMYWKLSNNACARDNFAIIDTIICEYQSFSSNKGHSNRLLNFMVPSQLIEIRGRILQSLRKYQKEYLDPSISKHLQYNTLKEMKTFSIKLRDWLEWCLRMIDVPMRIQCTTYLQMPNIKTDDFVCKLEKSWDGYYRVINRDKVHMSHQPLRIKIPLCLQ